VRASVVVPTHRRPDLLDRCLTSLVAQDLDPACFEVIVVDDASNEETRRRAEAWTCKTLATGPAIRYLSGYVGRGPAAKRNLGWRAARGRVIAFTDDDCIPSPTWLQAGLEAFVGGVSGVSGRIIVPIGPAPTDYELNASALSIAEFATANCFYLRDSLESVGGFDERFGTAWREDTDLYFRMLENGAQLVSCPTAVVEHPVRAASWGVSVGQQRKSMYNALLYKKHPQLYRKKIQYAPPWRYYLTLAAAVAALVATLQRRPRSASASAIVWAAFTANFFHRRLRATTHAPRHVAEMAVTSIVIPPLAVLWRLHGAIKFRVFFI
jgi:glycosyltransferase involved in cell wall biosynthesis